MLKSPLVLVDWLYENLDAEYLIVLDASIPKVASDTSPKVEESIPNSLFFDIKKKFSDTTAAFPNTLPSTEQFQIEAQKLGINKDSVIVVYDNLGMYSSARAWWLFKAFGFNNVGVLNGGLPEWKAKGYPISESYVEPTSKGNFKAQLNTSFFTDFEGITEHTKDTSTTILDARSAVRFKGEVSEPRQGLRSGTIPNSENLPYTSLLQGNTFKSLKELATIFNTFVSNPKQHLIFSCGSGITACNLALTATLLGYKNLSVYDGSWTEYGTLTD